MKIVVLIAFSPINNDKQSDGDEEKLSDLDHDRKNLNQT